MLGRGKWSVMQPYATDTEGRKRGSKTDVTGRQGGKRKEKKKEEEDGEE